MTAVAFDRVGFSVHRSGHPGDALQSNPRGWVVVDRRGRREWYPTKRIAMEMARAKAEGLARL